MAVGLVLVRNILRYWFCLLVLLHGGDELQSTYHPLREF